MAYISARTCSILGIENLDTIITIVSSEMSFREGSCRVEASRLVCNAGQLTGFCMTQSFAEASFRTDHNVCSEMPFRGDSCRVETN